MQPIQLKPDTLLNNGRYRIHRELNRGGTAVVYASEDMHRPGTYCALKVMNGPDTVPIKVVKREIAFSAAARHNNIVQLLDVFAEHTQLVIVWELISGPDLLDLLNEHEGRLPEHMAAFFFCQLLQAVQYMHDKGYTHRDVKPENCMIQRSNHQLKLIDFGLSKHLESAKTLGVGTPDYLSPEMLQAWAGGFNGTPKGYDARAVDAWAMGVMMYLLCTGKYPFEDPKHPNVLSHTIQNVLHGRMQPFPSTMSEGCQNLILGLLRVNVKERTTLQDLSQCSWLLKSAQAYANQVGRIDLLAPLLTLSRQVSAERASKSAQLKQQEDRAAAEGAVREEGSSAANGNLRVDMPADSSATLLGPTGRKSQRSSLSKVCCFLRRHIF